MTKEEISPNYEQFHKWEWENSHGMSYKSSLSMHLLLLFQHRMLIYLDPCTLLSVFSGVCECPLVGIWLEMLNWVCFLLWDAEQTDNGVHGFRFLWRAGPKGWDLALPLFSALLWSPHSSFRSHACLNQHCAVGLSAATEVYRWAVLLSMAGTGYWALKCGCWDWGTGSFALVKIHIK